MRNGELGRGIEGQSRKIEELQGASGNGWAVEESWGFVRSGKEQYGITWQSRNGTVGFVGEGSGSFG